MGYVYFNQGNHDDAIYMYERAVAILVDAHLQNPELAKLYDNIANCYAKQNRYDDVAAIRQKSDDIRHNLQQVDTINQISTNITNKSQGNCVISIIDILTLIDCVMDRIPYIYASI